MDSWDDLRFLLAVSKSGSMTGAASVLHTSVATVSRRLDRIATRMGTAPFVKTSDGWAPSAAVAGLIDLAMDFEGNLKREINARGLKTDLAAVDLRIGSTPTVLMSVLVPGLSLRGSDMDHIQFEFGERVFGDGLGDYDLLLSHGSPKTGRVLTRKVADVTFAIYGPETAEASGNWVGLSEPHDAYGVMQMAFDTFDKRPVLRADNLLALARIIEETGLPGPLPDILAHRREGLRPLGTARYHADFWVSYHESRRGDPAIDLTLAWIDACFNKVAAGMSSQESKFAHRRARG